MWQALKEGFQHYLELVLFSVDDYSRDLLIHKDENGTEESWHCCNQQGPPRVISQRAYDPAPTWISRLLNFKNKKRFHFFIVLNFHST